MIMKLREKTVAWDDLEQWAQAQKTAGKRVVVTNGCFDILHLGHVNYLEEAAGLGDMLLVGVNSDRSVREIKGEGRPINPEMDRALVLAGLASVGAVCVFDEVDAQNLLSRVRPDIYVKGGDYNLETINQPERRLVESHGGKVVVLGGVPGKSTTSVLERMKGKEGPGGV